jgi:hypothetical protein
MSDRTAKGTFCKGNRVNRTHAADSFRSLGRLPAACRSWRGDLNALRAALTSEVRQRLGVASGPIPPLMAARIHAVVTAEGCRRLWGRWLSKRGDALEPADFIRAMAECRQAGESRDRSMAELLAPPAVDTFAGLLSRSVGPTTADGPDVPPHTMPDAAPGDWGVEVSER